MPFRSRSQQRYAFATGQPWAKEWADKTKNFKKLPEKVKKKKKKVITEGFHMRPAFAAIINMLQESDWVMDRVGGTLSAPAQAIDTAKEKPPKHDQRKRMKKAMHKRLTKNTGKGTSSTTAGTRAVDPSK